jgi:hypothetical protein
MVTDAQISSRSASEPVTATDVRNAVMLALTAFRSAAGADWDVPAGAIDWTCWETVEHMSDDLFAYAAQLGPANPGLVSPVPFRCEPRRPGGPAVAIAADRDAGAEGLLQVLEATGALLAAMVTASSAHRSADPQPFGVPDPARFAASVGVAEVLLHAHDVCAGLGVGWRPPDRLCRRVLGRLFPQAPGGPEAWRTLLWATGRGDLPGHTRVTSWHWDPGR